MHAHAQAVSHFELATQEHARQNARLEPARNPTRAWVPALRQGPSLRKLLGPTADELWGKLQMRAYRAPDRLVRITATELAGKRGSVRTVGWALKRLADAHLIAKVKTRTGLAIRVLAFDRDQWGNGEYSPYLPPRTLQWMNGKRPRGRPKKPAPKETMPEPQQTHSAGRETRQPGRERPAYTPPPRPLTHEEQLRITQAFPFVPPDPRQHVRRPPLLPRPPMLDPNDRPSTHREVLIELYVTAARVFWPHQSVSREVKAMRSRHGTKLLQDAATELMEQRLPPAMWVRNRFAHALKNKRKSPLRAEILFDPAAIEKWGPEVAEAEVELCSPQAERSEEFRIYREGYSQLASIWDHTMRRIRSELLDMTDEAAVRAIVTEHFPTGWQDVYASANAKMTEIAAVLDSRAQRGQYLWGLPRG